MQLLRQATTAARSATNALQSVTAICVNLMPFEGVLSEEQRSARSELYQDVLRAQALMLALKSRAEALRDLPLFTDSKIPVAES